MCASLLPFFTEYYINSLKNNIKRALYYENWFSTYEHFECFKCYAIHLTHSSFFYPSFTSSLEFIYFFHFCFCSLYKAAHHDWKKCLRLIYSIKDLSVDVLYKCWSYHINIVYTQLYFIYFNMWNQKLTEKNTESVWRIY